MLAQIRKARREESGFTLIELLIVIVILGVLAGIVVFAVGGITDTGETAACDANVKTVTTAVEAYRAQEGDYPTDEADAIAKLVPGFLEEVPAADVAYTLGTTPSGADDPNVPPPS